MKLKTLKDMEVWSDWVKHKELRQEAIKWVKFYRSAIDRDTDQYWNPAVRFIMNFFNLTEEDLK